MCGIHGVITKASFSKTGLEGFMKDGFVAGALRGMDSSGIMQIDKAGKPFMCKLALPGPSFVESKVAAQFFRDAPSCPMTIGHVRAATAGKVTADNAHPFCVNRADGTRLMGVHNGTLNGWSYKKDGTKFDVDSEWAFNQIAADGADAFEEFLGAWAFVWWDERTKDKVYVARNDQRPLHFIRTKDKSGILLASEVGMLAWLAERNRIDVEDTIYSFDAGKLYTLDMSGGEVKWSKSIYPAYKTPVYTPTNNNSSYAGGANRGHWNPNSARWESPRDRRHGSGACGLGNEGDDWEGYGSYYTSQSSGTSGNKTAGNGELTKEAKEVIDAAKSALAANRDKRFQKDKTKSEGTSTVAEGTTQGQEKKENEGTEYSCKPNWYSSLSATVDEKAAAEEAGVFGELQWFTGIHFEPDTCEIYGEIEDFIVGQGKVKYDAIFRFATRSDARRLCLPDGKGCWVAVIGKGSDRKYQGTYYTVAPLNDIGLTALRNRAA